MKSSPGAGKSLYWFTPNEADEILVRCAQLLSKNVNDYETNTVTGIADWVIRQSPLSSGQTRWLNDLSRGWGFQNLEFPSDGNAADPDDISECKRRAAFFQEAQRVVEAGNQPSFRPDPAEPAEWRSTLADDPVVRQLGVLVYAAIRQAMAEHAPAVDVPEPAPAPAPAPEQPTTSTTAPTPPAGTPMVVTPIDEVRIPRARRGPRKYTVKTTDGRHVDHTRAGERNNNSKLTWAQVEMMRAVAGRGLITQAEIAALCGITRAQTSIILKGRAWRRRDRKS